MNETVLFVAHQDDSHVVSGYQFALEKENYKFVDCMTPKEALQKMGEVDIMILFARPDYFNVFLNNYKREKMPPLIILAGMRYRVMPIPEDAFIMDGATLPSELIKKVKEVLS
ncbi:hypothetical protein ACFLZ4_01095 [Patescibacteria group bacterium]